MPLLLWLGLPSVGDGSRADQKPLVVELRVQGASDLGLRISGRFYNKEASEVS